MNTSLNQHLEQIVRSCKTWSEAKSRVVNSYGKSYLYDAEGIALETRGREWIDGENLASQAATQADSQMEWSPQNEGNKSMVSRESSGESKQDSIAQRWVLIVAATGVMFAMLFPPFYMPLPENLTTNKGFSFILQPPGSETYRALVNVPLLLTEIFVVLIVAAIAWRLSGDDGH